MRSSEFVVLEFMWEMNCAAAVAGRQAGKQAEVEKLRVGEGVNSELRN